MSVNIDDTDPVIQYSGSWQVLMNSPLEFGGGVHSTTQTGASATITFTGTRIQLFCTVPMNSGTETADFTFDGHTGPPLSRESHPDTTYYKDGWFDSGPLADTVHVLTVSNGGGLNDAPLQLDYFSIAGSVASPTPSASPNPPPSSPTPSQEEKTKTVTEAAVPSSTTSSDGTSSSLERSSSSSTFSSSSFSSSSSANISASTTSNGIGTVPMVTSVQYVTSTAANGSITAAANAPESALRSSSSRTSVGAIVGGVLGGFILVLLILILLLWRRRKTQHIELNDDAERSLNPRNPTVAVPFRLDTNSSSVSNSGSGSREMAQINTKSSPSRYISSPISPMGSDNIATSTVSNNASNSDEKDATFISSPTNHPALISPFSDPNLLVEEDAGPFVPPPSYQSTRGSKQ
ncbi:hypothetical protein CPB84DRAFT_1791527 [Gymnopilus junonius]|uniref:Uncharacterized protein n=1 Tax=Gymnopilus junonius TaxID=109634 RepID=A0A9P5TIV6_GYMJU|nr:hypothetical protein CPB84DRAFT_1791527 [Gymnopilus junonius]